MDKNNDNSNKDYKDGFNIKDEYESYTKNTYNDHIDEDVDLDSSDYEKSDLDISENTNKNETDNIVDNEPIDDDTVETDNVNSNTYDPSQNIEIKLRDPSPEGCLCVLICGFLLVGMIVMLLNFVKPVASNVVMSASGISQEFLEDIDSYEGKIYYTYDTIEDISFTIEDLETKTVNGEKMYDLSLRIESPKIELMLDKQNEENIFEVTLSESEYLESLELKNDKFNIAYYVMYTVISINGKREIIMESKAVHSFEDNYEKITDSTLDDYVFEFKKNLEKYINKESSKEELFVNYLEEESYKELNEKINNDKFFALLIKTFLSSDIYKYHSKFELPN